MIRSFLSFVFFVAGILHFTHKDVFLRIMPPFVPLPKEMVFLTGVVAIFLGWFIWIKPDLAAWGMILYLIVVFPVNIYMACHPELFPSVPAWVWWARLPLQPLMLGLAYFVAKQ